MNKGNLIGAEEPDRSAHTPGPWWVDVHRNVLSSAGMVAFPCIQSAPLKDAEVANARLIAAAPDLLIALQVLLEEAEESAPYTTDGIGVARAAIAKATGASHE